MNIRTHTPVRLVLAAVLCVVPLRLVWSSATTPGTTLYGDCGYSDGPYCTGDQYLPGSTSTTLVAQAPVAVLLVLAAAIFVWCAVTPRTLRTLTVARGGCLLVAVALLLAAHERVAAMVVCLGVALVLVAPRVMVTPRGKAPPRTISY